MGYPNLSSLAVCVRASPASRNRGAFRISKENEVTQAIEVGGLRNAFQQEGLRRCGAFLVSELHSALRAHSAGARGPLRVGQGHTRRPPLRERAYSRQWRLRVAPWPVLRHGPAGELDRGG